MVLLGGAMYGTMSSFVKQSYAKGYHAAEIAFYQAFIAALLLGGYSLFTLSGTDYRKMTSKSGGFLLLAGGCIGLTNFLYYQSVSYISASLAIVILMQFTWISMLLEWLFFRKKPGAVECITVAFILAGTVLAGELTHANVFSVSWKGIVLALATSFTYALYIVANSRMGKEVKWQMKSTVIMLGSSSLIFLVNLRTIVAGNYLNQEFLLWAIFLAVAGTTIPTALFSVGIPKIGAGTSAILMTVEFPVAVLCAYVVLGEALNIVQIIGIAIMLVAITAMNYVKLRVTNRVIPFS
ncbi:permease of the drug/metabolite transporter (DMT) superfamily [Filimonas lacunae]|nr:permease of the drug/metabolite transporter (DMT) superfamily [Filimonas lacunae]